MLYFFKKQNELPVLAAPRGVTIREIDDPVLLSFINQISEEEAVNRLANDHKAYVAFLEGIPAAFGWVASGKARVGELNHEFILPMGHRYLWNFRTLQEFRGLGIYPYLLQQIILAEQPEAECLWIIHAPENIASRRGIQKAGFRFVGDVSVVNGNEVIFDPTGHSRALYEVLETFEFIMSPEPQASCWNCSSPFLKKRNPKCCCLPAKKECTRNLFNPAQTTRYPNGTSILPAVAIKAM